MTSKHHALLPLPVKKLLSTAWVQATARGYGQAQPAVTNAWNDLTAKFKRGWETQPFSARGVVCLLFSAVLLFVFAYDESDLVANVIGTGLATFCVLSAIVCLSLRKSLRQRIMLEAHFDQKQLISRKPVDAGIVLRNSSLPPLFAIELRRQFSTVGVRSPGHIVTGKEASERRSLLDTVVFPHRGSWTLDTIEFSVKDAFGLARCSWKVPVGITAEVQARVLPIRPLPIVSSSSRAGDQLDQATQRSGDPFDIKAYDPSDGVSRILWKTYARTRQLVVRRPEPAIVPEGEVALFLIAGRKDDHVAGALLSYLEQLENENVSVLFGTDGMVGNVPVLTQPDSIRSAIPHSVWSERAGTGLDLAGFLRTLQDGGRYVQRLVVFAPEAGDWLDVLTQTCSVQQVEPTLALVPNSLERYSGGESSASYFDFTFDEELIPSRALRTKVQSLKARRLRAERVKLSATLAQVGGDFVVCEPYAIS